MANWKKWVAAGMTAGIVLTTNIVLTEAAEMNQKVQGIVNKEKHVDTVFPMGGPNEAYAKYFIGGSYLNMLTTEGVVIGNVTFEPGCRNNWHIHKAEKGGGQILLCTNGRGWYQEWGKEPRALQAGDVVVIPAGVKHWHGAAADSWFTHLSIEIPGEKSSNEWCEPVEDVQYSKLG